MDISPLFSTFLQRETTSVTFLFVILNDGAFSKMEHTLKGKEQMTFLSIDPYWKGRQNESGGVVSLESVHIHLNKSMA